MASLTFKSISISKLPGMHRGISRLEDLSPRVNIITGPNGAGKSSTARYIHKLVWRESMETVVSAEAQFEINNNQWGAETTGGTSRFQENGIPATPATLPAKEAKPAYMLALHDLVIAEDKELATEIMRESRGGYDLGNVREKFEYEGTIKSTRSGEYTTFNNALKELNEIQTEQRKLKDEEKMLSELRRKRERADLARHEEAFYKLYCNYLKANERVQELETRYEQFPLSVKNATGDDPKQLSQFEKDISKAEKDIQAAKAIIAKNRESIASLKLPDVDIDQATINVLQNHVNDLGQTEKEIVEEGKSKTRFETRAKEALRGIGGEVDEEAWQGLELPAVQKLDRFLLDAYQLYGKAEVNKQKINANRKELESLPESDSIKISRAIYILQAWLKNDKSFFGISDTWFFILAGSALIAAIATWFIGWPALIAGVLAIIVVAVVGYLKKPQKTGQNSASEYAETGMEQLDEWTAEAVINRLEKLSEELTAAKKREGLQQLLKDLENDQTILEQKLEAIKERYDEWRLELHAVPGLPEAGIDSYAGMYHFMTMIREWQVHHAEAKASDETLNALHDKHQSLLKKINEYFKEYECKLARTHAEAKAELDSLKEKVSKRNTALNQIGQQEIILNTNEKAKQDAEIQLKTIYERLDVEVGMQHEVSRLVDMLPDFKQVQSDLDHEQRNLIVTKKQLESHQLFNDRQNELNSLDIESTEAVISECAEIYYERDEIVEKIKEITVRVDDERASSRMELAMHKRDNARSDLEALFEQNLVSVTGQLIYDEISAEVRENTMPEVLEKANEHFISITQGRYKLIIDHTGDGAFRALDTNLGRSKELDELSTGTRLQLLLAVRLAYIESREAGLKLPLLADEVLANSDDLRSNAIIEALIEISRTGRQVFYFTARENEVSHWQAVLQNKKEKPRILRLTGQGNEEIAQAVAEKELPRITFLEQVPEPGSLTHQEYGKKLMIQPFDPVNDNTAQLHIWYLTENNVLLHSLLTKGVKSWGQLHSYISHSGLIAELDKQTFEKMQQKVLLLKHFCELYKVGRPKKIDIDVLIESNAVTNKFIDRVGARLKELNGDPEELIKALENGEVPRFQSRYTEDLKNYFVEEGYIDNREVYSDDTIRLQMLSYQSQLGIQPEDAEVFMGLITGNLC